MEHEHAEAYGIIFVPRLIQGETMKSSLAQRTDTPTPEMQKLFLSGIPVRKEIGEDGGVQNRTIGYAPLCQMRRTHAVPCSN